MVHVVTDEDSDPYYHEYFNTTGNCSWDCCLQSKPVEDRILILYRYLELATDYLKILEPDYSFVIFNDIAQIHYQYVTNHLEEHAEQVMNIIFHWIEEITESLTEDQADYLRVILLDVWAEDPVDQFCKNWFAR